jgi:hypothetical protein
MSACCDNLLHLFEELWVEHSVGFIKDEVADTRAKDVKKNPNLDD